MLIALLCLSIVLGVGDLPLDGGIRYVLVRSSRLCLEVTVLSSDGLGVSAEWIGIEVLVGGRDFKVKNDNDFLHSVLILI